MATVSIPGFRTDDAAELWQIIKEFGKEEKVDE
jgi:hypothetical protein